MIDRLKNGCKPTVLLYELVKKHPELTIYELASAFCEQFKNLDGEAVQTIWYWESGGRKNGFTDSELDEKLIELLKKAGYL